MSPRSGNAQLAQIFVHLPIGLPLRNDEDEFSAEAIGLVSAAGSSQSAGLRELKLVSRPSGIKYIRHPTFPFRSPVELLC